MDEFDFLIQLKFKLKRSRQRNIHKIWISACIGSERNGKALIKIGNTLDKDGFWYKCAYFPENQTGIYTEGKLLEAICDLKYYKISKILVHRFNYQKV